MWGWLRSLGRAQSDRLDVDPRELSLILLSMALHHAEMLEKGGLVVPDEEAEALFGELVAFYFSLFLLTVVERCPSDVTRNAYGSALRTELSTAATALAAPDAFRRAASDSDEWWSRFRFYYRDEMSEAERANVERLIRRYDLDARPVLRIAAKYQTRIEALTTLEPLVAMKLWVTNAAVTTTNIDGLSKVWPAWK